MSDAPSLTRPLLSGSGNLTGGALPQNVFWQVAGTVAIGTTAHMEGVVMSQTAITLGTGASVNGRLLAQDRDYSGWQHDRGTVAPRLRGCSAC